MSLCQQCGAPILGRNRNAKFCSDQCRDRAKWLRQKAANPCPSCREPMSRSSATSSDKQLCRKCKFGDPNTGDVRGKSHGSETMYSYHKCRCDICVKSRSARIRAWRERRKAAGKPVETKRRMVQASCDACGISFLARPDLSGRFCSMACAGNMHGRTDWSNGDRQKIAKSVREEIFAHADGACQLCFAPTRPEADVNHPRYPNIDHIVPWSKGGTNDRENLRLVCRQCNITRGANENWVPERLEAAS